MALSKQIKTLFPQKTGIIESIAERLARCSSCLDLIFSSCNYVAICNALHRVPLFGFEYKFSQLQSKEGFSSRLTSFVRLTT